MFSNTEEDLSYIHTVAQGLIQRAFEHGLITVWSNGKKYKVDSIAYDSRGSIDIFKGKPIKEKTMHKDIKKDFKKVKDVVKKEEKDLVKKDIKMDKKMDAMKHKGKK